MDFNLQIEETGERSEIERYNRMILNLTATMFILAVAYYFINLFLGFDAPWFIFAGLALSAAVSHILFRLRKDFIAKIQGLLCFNLLVYAVASSESPLTNVNLYFVTAGVSALVLFNNKERAYSYAAVAISLALYLVAKYSLYSPLAYRNFTDAQIDLLSIINLIAFVGVSAYLIVLLLESNFRKKKNLQDQNLKLIKLNRELDRFIYSSSHDLRAPLSSLLGLIRLSELEKNEATKLDYLQMMKKRIETMDLFISELIDYSKNIRQDVELTEISLYELVTEVHNDLKYMEGASSLAIDFNSLAMVKIKCDLMRLKIIFSNIISNAIKYKKPNCQDSTLTINSSLDPKNLIIEFVDNGIGIPEDQKNKIFEMFHRAHFDSVGSGLGLYIVKETLITLSGSIKVYSTEGVGSRFTIQLPNLS